MQNVGLFDRATLWKFALTGFGIAVITFGGVWGLWELLNFPDSFLWWQP